MTVKRHGKKTRLFSYIFRTIFVNSSPEVKASISDFIRVCDFAGTKVPKKKVVGRTYLKPIYLIRLEKWGPWIILGSRVNVEVWHLFQTNIYKIITFEYNWYKTSTSNKGENKQKQFLILFGFHFRWKESVSSKDTCTKTNYRLQKRIGIHIF